MSRITEENELAGRGHVCFSRSAHHQRPLHCAIDFVDDLDKAKVSSASDVIFLARWIAYEGSQLANSFRMSATVVSFDHVDGSVLST